MKICMIFLYYNVYLSGNEAKDSSKLPNARTPEETYEVMFSFRCKSKSGRD